MIGTTGRAVPLRATLADLAPPFGFDHRGYVRHARDFLPIPEVDPSGRLAVVTGATSGLGLETVRALAGRGWDVVLWGRDAARAEEHAAALRGAGGEVLTAVADLGEPEQVARAADALPDRRLDALICNAGALPAARTLTGWGHEQVWASQVLGHHLLVRRLLADGRLGDGSRVVWVASGGMYLVGLDLSDLRWDRRPYDGTRAYAVAKRAQVVLCEAMQARFGARGVRFAAMHPGWADTPGVRTALPRFFEATRAILRSPAEGADTSVWLATTAAAWPGGRFWFDRAPVAPVVLPWTRPTDAARAALWAQVEEAVSPWLDPISGG